MLCSRRNNCKRFLVTTLTLFVGLSLVAGHGLFYATDPAELDSSCDPDCACEQGILLATSAQDEEDLHPGVDPADDCPSSCDHCSCCPGVSLFVVHPAVQLMPTFEREHLASSATSARADGVSRSIDRPPETIAV